MLIVAVVLIVVVVVAVVGGVLLVGFVANRVSNTISKQQVVNIVNETITIQPGHYNYYWVNIPTGSTIIHIAGTFTVSGGGGYYGGNYVEVLVMDQTNYANWQNQLQSSPLYDSGQVASGTISASLTTSGKYYLIYSNNYSSTIKTVQTTASLYYYIV